MSILLQRNNTYKLTISFQYYNRNKYLPFQIGLISDKFWEKTWFQRSTIKFSLSFFCFKKFIILGMANSSERRRQWNLVVAGVGCYKKWPVKKRVFTEDRSEPKPPVWSLIIGIFFLYQFQLKCGCELNDQIESFNFDGFLWPIERVWVLGLLSILLCLIFFFFFFW